MSPKNFKGIVKISDVQTEFDNLVFNINNAINSYNDIEEIQGIDYTKAGSTLAPLGYTLTVGGLKQFMQIYDGYTFGVRVMKTGTNQCKPTNGIFVSKDGFKRIPDNNVSGYGTMLFYDPKKNKCQIGGAAKVFKTFTQPKITSNTSWGSFSASSNSGNAWKSTRQGDSSSLLSFGWQGAISPPKREVPVTESVKWQFPSPVKLSNIAFTFGWVCMYPYAGGNSIKIVDLKSGKTIASRTGLQGGLLSTYSWNVPTNTTTTGIRIDITYRTTSGNATTLLGNLKIQGQIEQWQGSDEIGDKLYKIADLNWEKASSDKLWLNDLPHTMF